MMIAPAQLAAMFAALFAGHHVGDHVAQTDWQAHNKAARGWLGARAMLGHLLGYGTSQAVALALLVTVPGAALPLPTAAVALAVSLATHGFIDRRWPVRWIQEHTRSSAFVQLSDHGINGMYLTDQSLHIGCLFLAAWAGMMFA